MLKLIWFKFLNLLLGLHVSWCPYIHPWWRVFYCNAASVQASLLQWHALDGSVFLRTVEKSSKQRLILSEIIHQYIDEQSLNGYYLIFGLKFDCWARYIIKNTHLFLIHFSISTYLCCVFTHCNPIWLISILCQEKNIVPKQKKTRRERREQEEI